MIKMNYGDASHQKNLKIAYIQIFPEMPLRQTFWVDLRNRLIQKNNNFRYLLPNNYEEMLVLDFKTLADIYELYDALDLKSNDTPLYCDSKALFSYDKRCQDSKGRVWQKLQPDIAAFFIDKNNGFEIHSCHYCDMAYVNPFTLQTSRKSQFDLDHVLDKKRCPIIALSLFNFVPSCQICNGSRVKGQKQLYSEARLRKKLSPTNADYDFEGKVTIEVINKKGNSSTIGFEKRMDDYEIRFNSYLDPDYQEEVKAFYLQERYEYHKCEALRLLDLKERYTDSRIMELARLISGGSNTKIAPLGLKYLTQLKQDIFSINYNHKFHRCFGKLHDDILK